MFADRDPVEVKMLVLLLINVLLLAVTAVSLAVNLTWTLVEEVV